MKLGTDDGSVTRGGPIVNVVAPFSNRGGWGRHSRCFSLALEDAVCVRRFDLGDFSFGHCRDWNDCVSIIMAPPSLSFRKRSGPLVFSTVWETSCLPKEYVANLAIADQVWVPTQWGAEILCRSGVTPSKVRVVPEGIDPQAFVPMAKHRRKTFNFLYVGKWEVRKATAALIRAFVAEFSEDEGVSLTMHFGHGAIHGNDVGLLVRRELERCDSQGKHVVVSTRLEENDLVLLMQQADAFVLPTRAEGWGLPILEAMACGVPCIVPNYGGHLTFANEENSYLVEVARLVSVIDPVFFPADHEYGFWAQPDFRHLRQLMRHATIDRSGLERKGRRARVDASTSWTWARSAMVALEALRELGVKV